MFCVCCCFLFCIFFCQAEDGIRDLVRSRGLGDVYKRQARCSTCVAGSRGPSREPDKKAPLLNGCSGLRLKAVQR